MLALEARPETAGPELEEAVERQINQRTWGRIHQLHVELTGGRVIVHGYSPTYYVKQLALSAVQDVCHKLPVDMDVLVG
jgi:hypothetical protein